MPVKINTTKLDAHNNKIADIKRITNICNDLDISFEATGFFNSVINARLLPKYNMNNKLYYVIKLHKKYHYLNQLLADKLSVLEDLDIEIILEPNNY